MKTPITLQRAYELIEQASAIIVDGETLVYPSLDQLTGAPDNEWMFITLDNGYDEPQYLKFIEEGQLITLDGSCITMEDSEGDLFQLCLLVPMKVQS